MPRIIYDKDKIIADWKTDKYTERSLADKHGVSKATVHNIVKGVEKSIAQLVTKQVAINQEVAKLNNHEITKFKEEVDERTRLLQFFSDAAQTNVKIAIDKITEETSQAEHRMLADTILKGREAALGKQPDTAIQINNSQPVAAVKWEVPTIG